MPENDSPAADTPKTPRIPRPPSREELVELLRRMDLPVRDVLRRKGTPYDELGLDDPRWDDDQLLELMLRHPVLIDRFLDEADTLLIGGAMCFSFFRAQDRPTAGSARASSTPRWPVTRRTL